MACIVAESAVVSCIVADPETAPDDKSDDLFLQADRQVESFIASNQQKQQHNKPCVMENLQPTTRPHV